MLAEAEADAHKVKAAADAQAKQHEADGDAYAQRTVPTAEAEAINVRADALGDGNQALIAANKLIDALPSLVAEAAQGIAGSNLTILNGPEGVTRSWRVSWGRVYRSTKPCAAPCRRLRARTRTTRLGLSSPGRQDGSKAVERPRSTPAPAAQPRPPG
jgi:hypothetical protein